MIPLGSFFRMKKEESGLFGCFLICCACAFLNGDFWMFPNVSCNSKMMKLNL